LWRTYAQIGEDPALGSSRRRSLLWIARPVPGGHRFRLPVRAIREGFDDQSASFARHGILPAGGVEIIQEQVSRLAAKGETKLGFAFASRLGLALWSANAGMKALIDALNVIEKERRSFIRLNAGSLALTAGGLLAALTAVGAIVHRSCLCRPRRVNRAAPVAVAFADCNGDFWFGGALSDRSQPRASSLGMAFGGERASCASMACNFGLVVMVLGKLRKLRRDLRFAWCSHRPDDVAGGFHRSSSCSGAELNSEIEHQTSRDSTTSTDRQLGQRGAAG
jgi:membrane protein